jgi:hypothetical protein
MCGVIESGASSLVPKPTIQGIRWRSPISIGHVLNVLFLDQESKGEAVDKEADDGIMHQD